MTPKGQTICLCMIVKNEAPVIRRCLDSVRPLIDRWLIVDTGSTDGTQAIVRAHCADLPGELVERPWIDFAHNRSESLALARPMGDYTLIIDADDVFDVPPGFAMPDLDADSYTVDIDFAGVRYHRPQMVRAALPWRYEGVIHEFLACDEARSSGHLALTMRINGDGARRRDPDTYHRDIDVLERAVATETKPSLKARYMFYLAQSCRDAGESAKARDAYLARAELGHWEQEVFVSLYQAGKAMEALGEAREAVLAIYRRASDACPTRIEALHAASRLCRLAGEFGRGHAVAKPGLEIAPPPQGLFVETWIYDYGIHDEYAVNAYWAGHYRDCLEASLRALASGKVPPAEQARMAQNAAFALEHLPTRESAAPARQAAPAPELPRAINLGSGKDFRAECFNIDIDPTWHPDAVLDLSAITLDPAGLRVTTRRFGEAVLAPGGFDTIIANDVLEHVPDLVALMTTCLTLLRRGGRFEISVPYDLSFGAWQDPTHVRTFNERSWLYYTDWFWYLGWRDARFVLDRMEHVASPLGVALREKNVPAEEVNRTPRAIDSMSVTLRKVDLGPGDRATLASWRTESAPPNPGSSPRPAPPQWPSRVAGRTIANATASES